MDGAGKAENKRVWKLAGKSSSRLVPKTKHEHTTIKSKFMSNTHLFVFLSILMAAESTFRRDHAVLPIPDKLWSLGGSISMARESPLDEN
jgi:hypothetical protein